MRSKTLKKIPGNVGDVTYKGIEKWYRKEFESLGWMILAKSKGMTDKTQAYVNSLHRLKEAIETKKSKVYNADRVEDLRIMGSNLDILLKHVHKDF